jgi:fatty-acid desaturase
VATVLVGEVESARDTIGVVLIARASSLRTRVTVGLFFRRARAHGAYEVRKKLRMNPSTPFSSGGTGMSL